MTLMTYMSVFRIIMYLWVAIEFGNLAFLYLVGYKTVKTSPIIRSLRVMFSFLSALFFFYSFIPALYESNPQIHMVVIQFLPIFLIPVGFAVRRFRDESLRKQKMDLPDGDIKGHNKKHI